MPSYVSDAIIKTLGDVTDLQRVLEEYDMSAGQVLASIRTQRGREQFKARRRLARIHSELVAHRFSPYAVHKLCQLLSDEKPELRLKGALAILSLAGMGMKSERAVKKKAGGIPGEETVRTAEDGEVLAALAEVLAKRRAAEEAEGEGDCGGE